MVLSASRGFARELRSQSNGIAAALAPGVVFEEFPGMVGKVDVLTRLAKLLPKAAPRLFRIWPTVSHALGLCCARS